MREHSSMPFQLKGFVIDISRPRFGKGKVVEIAKNKIQIEFVDTFSWGPFTTNPDDIRFTEDLIVLENPELWQKEDFPPSVKTAADFETGMLVNDVMRPRFGTGKIEKIDKTGIHVQFPKVSKTLCFSRNPKQWLWIEDLVPTPKDDWNVEIGDLLVQVTKNATSTMRIIDIFTSHTTPEEWCVRTPVGFFSKEALQEGNWKLIK